MHAHIIHSIKDEGSEGAAHLRQGCTDADCSGLDFCGIGLSVDHLRQGVAVHEAQRTQTDDDTSHQLAVPHKWEDEG